MKRSVSFLIFLACAATACAQGEDLLKHVGWHALGSHGGQSYGVASLNTLGYINDSVRDPVSISEGYDFVSGGSTATGSYILNRHPLDTVRQFTFPGQTVVAGNFNGDAYKDFACWSVVNRQITILFGTAVYNQFEKPLVLPTDNKFGGFSDVAMKVADVDSDGFDDLFVVNGSYGAQAGGELLFYHGGPTFDSMPSQRIYGTASNGLNHIGGRPLAIGHIHDDSTMYLVNERVNPSQFEKVWIVLYPFDRQFHFQASDTIVAEVDTPHYCCIGNNGFNVFDVDGDGIDDMMIDAYDNQYAPTFGDAALIAVYKGGNTISNKPTYFFHRPVRTHSTSFGTRIVDAGDVTGYGYRSLLITDPQAYSGDAGAIFLYNIGKALKDSCVASASMPDFSEDRFGIQATSIGDVTGDNRAEFLVSADEINTTNSAGQVFEFLGSPTYGPVVGVKEKMAAPLLFQLDQNYPNPFSTIADIQFSIRSLKLAGASVELKLYDDLGRELETLFRGVADNYAYTIRIDAANLPSGTYRCQLTCGGMRATRLLGVVK